jgi:GTP-dependent phosphoenolpyruvate carboxykinase
MNHPSMEGQRLNVPAYVKHAGLIAWVAEIAALTEAADVYRNTTACASGSWRAAPSGG